MHLGIWQPSNRAAQIEYAAADGGVMVSVPLVLFGD